MHTTRLVRIHLMRESMKKTIFAVAILLLAGTLCSAQTVVDLTGQPSPTVALTAQTSTITMPDGKRVPMWAYACTSSGLSPDPCSVAPSTWAPGPTIIVKPGPLTINLTDSLPTPTSLVILGQAGGGLGQPVKIDGPDHPGQTLTTWPASSDGSFTPPAQGQRARSFVKEAVAGTPAVYQWANLKPGTYLYETGTHPSIQAPMGLYGVLVVTNKPTSSPFAAGKSHLGAFPNGGATLKDLPYDADQVLLLSEIDPVQNLATDAANGDESMYSHAVDYKPLYFLINGHAFDRGAPSLLPVGASVASKNVLLRFVNAGLRTHIPSTVGLSMSLVAEDGNVLPGVPKLQSEILLTAGKAVDAIVHPALTADSTAYSPSVFPIFDRQLSLSNGNRADGGIQGYLQVAGGALNASGLAGAVAPLAVNDLYVLPLNTTTFTNNVLANDIAISTATIGTQPAHGTVSLNPDGSFIYTPTGALVNDTFTYFGNGNPALAATVALGVTASSGNPTANSHTFSSNVQSVIKVPAPGILAYASDPGNYKLTASPSGTGLKAGTPFTLSGAGSNVTITLNADGSILAGTDAAGASSVTFPYIATNEQGQTSTAAVTLEFVAGNGPHVTLMDAQNPGPHSSTTSGRSRRIRPGLKIYTRLRSQARLEAPIRLLVQTSTRATCRWSRPVAQAN